MPSVLDVEDTRFDIDEKEETLGRRKRSRSDSKKVKKFKVTPLRVPIPTDENCKFSDDLDDSVCTICKICDDSVTLTGMRRHTKLKHKMRITKYKELHGPFEITEHVFHKCHLCDKILLLDNEVLTTRLSRIIPPALFHHQYQDCHGILTSKIGY